MIGLPIVGDDKYGDFGLNKEARASYGARKLMLAALRLAAPDALGSSPTFASSITQDCALAAAVVLARSVTLTTSIASTLSRLVGFIVVLLLFGRSADRQTIDISAGRADLLPGDAGREDPNFPEPEASFHGLKSALPDPQEYFLGKRFEALLPPGSGELLRYPPARNFLVGSDDPYWPYVGDGFKPFLSFARGGLGVGWGANAVSYDDDDLEDWPIGFADLASSYDEARRRLPIAGADDALSPYFPGAGPNQRR